jgi:hypothetical protein
MQHEQADHQHTGPTLICTHLDCKDSAVCNTVECLLQHRHAKHFISLPCLEQQVQDFIQDKTASLREIEGLVERYYDEVTEEFLRLAEEAKQDSVRAVAEMIGLATFREIEPVLQGRAILSLPKRQILALNELIHNNREDERLRLMRRKLSEKSQSVRGELSKFVAQ